VCRNSSNVDFCWLSQQYILMQFTISATTTMITSSFVSLATMFRSRLCHPQIINLILQTLK